MRKIFKIILGLVVIIILLVVAAGFVWRWIEDYSVEMSDNSIIPAPVELLPEVQADSTGWPRWKGVTDDNFSAFTNIITDWSNGLKLLWSVDYLCRGDQSVTWSCPVISGNHLVVPGRHDNNDIIFCFQPQTGALLWSHKFEAPADNPSYGEGPRATPTIDEDRVYVLSRGGLLQCLDLGDGSVIWTRHYIKMGGEEPKWGFAASPVVFDSTLIVHVGEQALVFGLDKFTGETRWQSGPAPGSYSTPVVIQHEENPILLLVGGKDFYALDPANGSTLWSVPWEVKNNINICTPVFSPQHTIAVISAWYQKGTQALRIDRENPEVLWHTDAFQAHQTDPIILGDFIYGFSGMSAHNKDEFKCLNLLTGEEQWASRELGTGQFIYIDPYFLSIDITGDLYLVEASSTALTIISKIENLIQTDNARLWTKPVTAQGNLYIRYANRLYCYRLAER